MARHEVLSSRTIFDGRIFGVVLDSVRLPDGTVADREIVRHPGAVAVVAIVDGDILMVRQMRHAVSQELLELPAGKLDAPNESPEACARRELEEETGYRCSSLVELADFFSSPGFTDERIRVYLTMDAAAQGSPPETDEGEPIALARLPLGEAANAVLDGRIRDSKTMIGVLLATARMEKAPG